jgi:hypothetical protein
MSKTKQLVSDHETLKLRVGYLVLWRSCYQTGYNLHSQYIFFFRAQVLQNLRRSCNQNCRKSKFRLTFLYSG